MDSTDSLLADLMTLVALEHTSVHKVHKLMIDQISLCKKIPGNRDYANYVVDTLENNSKGTWKKLEERLLKKEKGSASREDGIIPEVSTQVFTIPTAKVSPNQTDPFGNETLNDNLFDQKLHKLKINLVHLDLNSQYNIYSTSSRQYSFSTAIDHFLAITGKTKIHGYFSMVKSTCTLDSQGNITITPDSTHRTSLQPVEFKNAALMHTSYGAPTSFYNLYYCVGTGCALIWLNQHGILTSVIMLHESNSLTRIKTLGTIVLPPVTHQTVPKADHFCVQNTSDGYYKGKLEYHVYTVIGSILTATILRSPDREHSLKADPSSSISLPLPPQSIITSLKPIDSNLLMASSHPSPAVIIYNSQSSSITRTIPLPPVYSPINYVSIDTSLNFQYDSTPLLYLVDASNRLHLFLKNNNEWTECIGDNFPMPLNTVIKMAKEKVPEFYQRFRYATC